ncbi:hypothetical protein LV716_09510 [Flagellimonas sp. HMM57]|uniref:hypothetical protein n=1 Tax=unclassified Flagellimonas TaxID=2644544 RepID=UPI0013D81FE6|nr:MULTISPECIES: hypothetical protein [unclassified Flagellimonas]UII74503.1 hypothetical protein LV716_09510 [Flagellimonas sp. HMM57]
MKQAIIYWFVLLYLVAMVRPVGPMLEYIIYEDYIAEFLCVNKDKVELQCNGKCYLMQRLSEQNDEKKQGLPKIALEEYPIGFVDLLFFNSNKAPIIPNQNHFDYQNSYTYLYCTFNFHPPSTLS